MARRQYLDRLAAVPLFSDCSKKELQRISNASTEMDFASGSTLTREGQLGREAFVLMEGTARARRCGHPIAELGPGSLVGELALLDPNMRMRTATVETATDVHALVLTPSELAALVYVPSVASKVWVQLAVKIHSIDHGASRMARTWPVPGPGRLARI